MKESEYIHLSDMVRLRQILTTLHLVTQWPDRVYVARKIAERIEFLEGEIEVEEDD